MLIRHRVAISGTFPIHMDIRAKPCQPLVLKRQQLYKIAFFDMCLKHRTERPIENANLKPICAPSINYGLYLAQEARDVPHKLVCVAECDPLPHVVAISRVCIAP